MRFLVRIVFWLVLAAITIGPPALAVLALDRAPMVPERGRLSFDDLQRARDLFARYDPRRMTPEEITTITASVAELNTVIGAAVASFPQARSAVAVGGADIRIDATLELPLRDNPVGRFINLQAGIEPSGLGLNIRRLRIGTIDVPPVLAGQALRLGLDYFIGDGRGKEILASVKSIDVTGDLVSIVYRPPRDLVEDVQAAARRAIAAADPDAVRVYYRRVHQMVISGQVSRQSLAIYVGEIFHLAAQRSAGADPVEENKAAVLALAMYFGDERFERVTGAVRTGDLEGLVPRVGHVRLEGRRDWVQHFLVSAALAIAGGDGVANVIGEAKEINDADGPSGFSFTDIGADRAGVRFAERATASRASARALQQALARTGDEGAFFPRIGDLPEGLSEAAFRSRFGDMNTAEYRRLVAEIDRRIAAIPVYR